MARSRTPKAKAEVSGATTKHPGRFADRKAPKRVRPVGEPYAQMPEDQTVIWRPCVVEWPWLDSSDRTILRMACILTVRLDKEDVGVNTLQTLSSILSNLGATPADKTKVNHADGDGEEPEDKFFGRPN